MNRNNLSEELILLSKLESQIKETYDEEEIIQSINSFKSNGLSFFIEKGIEDRALYEVKALNDYLVDLLTEV
tara:strand:+ start:4983 stop:5198 length:216 start_codon:yes stop_codon:yes gene_type:complete